MRPNTSSSGILSTKRNRPVNTSMLTRMLVPKPKNAFQSPGTQNFKVGAMVADFMGAPLCRKVAQRLDQRLGAADPAEDAALRLDHPEAVILEPRKVAADAILEHQAV